MKIQRCANIEIKKRKRENKIKMINGKKKRQRREDIKRKKKKIIRRRTESVGFDFIPGASLGLMISPRNKQSKGTPLTNVSFGPLVATKLDLTSEALSIARIASLQWM